MGLCQRIKTDRVLYDERVFLTESEPAIPLGIVPARGSFIVVGESSVDVAVVECDLVRRDDTITGATITLFIDKNIVVRQPDTMPSIPFEFSFQRTFPVSLAKIFEASIDPADVARARCQIFDLTATDTLALSDDRRTLSETLLVAVKLKIVVEDQILVALCPENMSTLATLMVSLPGNG